MCTRTQAPHLTPLPLELEGKSAEQSQRLRSAAVPTACSLPVPTAGSLPAPLAQVSELQQLDDSDFVQQVDEWFEEIIFSLSEGSMMPETLPLLRDKAEASQNLALKRACELHLSQ